LKIFKVFFYFVFFAISLAVGFLFTYHIVDTQGKIFQNFSQKELDIIENIKKTEIEKGNFQIENWVGYKIIRKDKGYLVYMYPGNLNDFSFKNFIFALTKGFCCGNRRFSVDSTGKISYNKILEQKADASDLLDLRDGTRYPTIRIGNVLWMAKNLNYHGSPSISKTPFFSLRNGWYGFKPKGSVCLKYNEENCQKYGRLYEYETAKTACPVGWRLPKFIEWEELGKSGKFSNFGVLYAGYFSADDNGMYGFHGVDRESVWWELDDGDPINHNGLFIEDGLFFRKYAYSKKQGTPDFYSDFFSVRCVKMDDEK